MAYLLVKQPGKPPVRRELDGPLVLGRSMDCDLWLADLRLSRHHCRIERLDGQWHVTDLESRNGVRVNSHRVRHHPLDDGDEMRICSAVIVFHDTELVKRARPDNPFETSITLELERELEEMKRSNDSTIMEQPKPIVRTPEPATVPAPIDPDANIHDTHTFSLPFRRPRAAPRVREADLPFMGRVRERVFYVRCMTSSALESLLSNFRRRAK